MGRCVRQCEAAATTKVLTLSIRMQKSRAEIIELYVESITRQSARLPLYTYGIRIHMCAYVCVDSVIVVCKSCLTTRYEFVEYGRGYCRIYCAVDWICKCIFTRSSSQQTKANSDGDQELKTSKKKKKKKTKAFLSGGPCRYGNRYPERWEMLLACLMQAVRRGQAAFTCGGVYSWPTADTVLQVITGSSHGTYKILILPNKSVKNMANCTSTTTRKGAVKNIFKRMFWEQKKELSNECGILWKET